MDGSERRISPFALNENAYLGTLTIPLIGAVQYVQYDERSHCTLYLRAPI